jgi:AcrR family transcriptional regulator
MEELSGTKELILDAFVEMISSLGYENVSMRDIAGRVNIKGASIYNHFESKGKILEFVYEYYCKHQYDNRKPIESMKKLIETASMEELVPAFSYSFITEDQKMTRRMVLITKILYMRLYQDMAANAIFTEKSINNYEYVVGILKHGIEAGRIDPGFDVHTFADILIGSFVSMGMKAFSGANYKVGPLNEEERTTAMLSLILKTALKAPGD